MSERKGKLRWVEDYLIAQLKGEKKEGILLDTLISEIIGKYGCTKMTARSYVMPLFYARPALVELSAEYNGLIILTEFGKNQQ